MSKKARIAIGTLGTILLAVVGPWLLAANARETVRDGITGVWFDEQSVDALKVAVRRIESGALRFDPQVLHRHALAFDRARFLLEMQALIQRALREASAGVALAKPPVVFGHADVDEAAIQRGRAHGTGRDQTREHGRLE